MRPNASRTKKPLPKKRKATASRPKRSPLKKLKRNAYAMKP